MEKNKPERTVRDLPDAVLLERVMRNLLPGRPGEMERWAVVMDVFGLGSTFAWELCQRFGLDPEGKLYGLRCERCDKKTLKIARRDLRHSVSLMRAYESVWQESADDLVTFIKMAMLAWRDAVTFRMVEDETERRSDWWDWEVSERTKSEDRKQGGTK